MHGTLLEEVSAIEPLDELERWHLADAVAWMSSGVELCRMQKPATPPKHLVAYFPVLDGDHILLVDHRNANLWLPTGGHVEPGEHPRDTVRRELREELGIDLAAGQVGPPAMVTVTDTVGLTAGHTDVSLWYPVRHERTRAVRCDEGEFREARWFPLSDVPWNATDPHLRRFIAKWVAMPRAGESPAKHDR